MAVPNTNDFSLQNVADEIGGWTTPPGLSDCFTFSVASNFDPKYEGEKDRLYNFRNYGGVGSTVTLSDDGAYKLSRRATASCPSSDFFVSCEEYDYIYETGPYPWQYERRTGLLIEARKIQQYSFLDDSSGSEGHVSPYIYTPNRNGDTGYFYIPLNPHTVYMVSNDIIFVVADFDNGNGDCEILTFKIQPKASEDPGYEIVLVGTGVFYAGEKNDHIWSQYTGPKIACNDVNYIFVYGLTGPYDTDLPSFEERLKVYRFNASGVLSVLADEMILGGAVTGVHGILYQNNRLYYMEVSGYTIYLVSYSVSSTGILGGTTKLFNMVGYGSTSSKICGDGDRLVFVFSTSGSLLSISVDPSTSNMTLKDAHPIIASNFKTLEYNAATGKIFFLGSDILSCFVVDKNDAFVLKSSLLLYDTDWESHTGYSRLVGNTMYSDIILVNNRSASLTDEWLMYRYS